VSIVVVIELESVTLPPLIIGTVTSINISSIVFKQGNNVVHTISTNLPSVKLQTIEVDKPITFTDTIISWSALLPATSVATMVTVSLSCTDVCIAL
jgi:repressor of nif and glnA expression